MGQYYIAIILADRGTDPRKEYIRTYVSPRSYGGGSKLMEHSYIGTNFMNVIESLICPLGMFYKSRLVWAGDYAKEEEDCESSNLYRLTDSDENYNKECTSKLYNLTYYRYIVNHTQKVYVDKDKCIVNDDGYNIHPLPLLTSEGNSMGGGDYSGKNVHLCGSWARDTVSMETSIPDDYNELVCDFTEY
jgi:hypothetical protein